MRSWFSVLLTAVVGLVAPYLSADHRSSVQFGAGYRHDDLSWNFKIPNCDPIFSSRLHFKDIHILEIGVAAQSTCDCVYLRGLASFGWILDGTFTERFKEDITRFTSNIQECHEIENLREARTRAILDGRYVVNLNAAIGYPIYFCNCTLELAPVVGYSYREENIRLEQNTRATFRDHLRSSSSSSCGISSSESSSSDECNRGRLGLDLCKCNDEHFVTRWWGPYLGLDLNYTPCDCWAIYASIEGHWAQFKGRRQTNSGFCSFDDFSQSTRHAHGFILRAGANYDICDCWFVGLNASYQDFKGHTKTRVCDEFSSEFNFDRLRTEAKLHSYTICVSVGRHF